jgi:membrane protein required for colicin V production
MVYDALLLLILLYHTWRGAARGVTWQLAGLAAILLCFLFAAPLSIQVAPLVQLDPPLNRYVAMLAIYLVFSLGSFAAARTIRGLLETLRFQEFDRHLGAVMGFLKGATLCLILTFFVVTISGSAREQVLRRPGGRLAGYLLYRIDGVLPRELDGVLAPHFNKIEGELIEIAVEEEQQGKSGHPLGLPFDLDPRGDTEADPGTDDLTAAAAPATEEPMAASGDSSDREQSRDEIRTGDRLWNDLAGALVGRIKDQVSEAVRGAFNPTVETSAGQPGEAAGEPKSRETSSPRRDSAPRLETPLVPRERRPALTAADDPEVDRLLEEVCRAFSGRDSARQQLQRQVTTMLDGVPATLARQALADWRSDLYGTLPDPDPGTDIDTPLEERILRQLSKARLSLQDLPHGVQSRLQRTR